jgi:alpha-1,2-glucosyltransferase
MITEFYVVLPILISYSYIFVGFIGFLVWNNGIVLGYIECLPCANRTGDRSNHIAGINIPQIFYCAVVIAGFGAPILLSIPCIRRYLRSCFFGYRNFFVSLFAMGILLIIVHYNT